MSALLIDPDPPEPQRVAADLAAITAALTTRRFACPNERVLQYRVGEVLAAADIDARPEVDLGPETGRLDFLTAAGVGIEVKVRGSAATALRQMARYAAHPRVGALILVTTRATHLDLPETLHGVPLRTVFLGTIL